ncbi:MAG: GNAT family N-acetyltransferase [Caldilineaceae bacterium]|nr:GNAT family N-acetyltransferase [Caldilineaceae bacterium]
MKYHADPTHLEQAAAANPPTIVSVTVVTANPYRPAARLLIDHLWEELDRRYGPYPDSRFTPEQIDVPGLLFVIAKADGKPVGCGAILPFSEGVGEIKRMWVEPDARRQGVAQAILYALESMAAEKGDHTLRLETGIRQPEAIALHTRWGYAPVDCWDVHADDPLSRCFEKRIKGNER